MRLDAEIARPFELPRRRACRRRGLVQGRGRCAADCHLAFAPPAPRPSRRRARHGAGGAACAARAIDDPVPKAKPWACRRSPDIMPPDCCAGAAAPRGARPGGNQSRRRARSWLNHRRRPPRARSTRRLLEGVAIPFLTARPSPAEPSPRNGLSEECAGAVDFRAALGRRRRLAPRRGRRRAPHHAAASATTSATHVVFSCVEYGRRDCGALPRGAFSAAKTTRPL